MHINIYGQKCVCVSIDMWWNLPSSSNVHFTSDLQFFYFGFPYFFLLFLNFINIYLVFASLYLFVSLISFLLGINMELN